MKKLFVDFKNFCLRGNVLDLAVAVMIGAAFGAIVTSLVNDVLMPVIGLITGGIDLSGLFVALDGGSYASLEAAKAVGAATLNYGAFLQSILNFLIVALSVFVIVKLVATTKRHKEEAPVKEERKCSFCKQTIAEDATRCPYCTSELSTNA